MRVKAQKFLQRWVSDLKVLRRALCRVCSPIRLSGLRDTRPCLALKKEAKMGK